MSRLAYLGPEGTFTERAARGIDAEDHHPCATLRRVFDEVSSGASSSGVVPAENAIEGSVDQTLDLLLETGLQVRGEIVLPIVHRLVGRRGTEVFRVFSHPQALAQCGPWLDRHLPRAERVESSSTTAGAARASREPDAAAIAPNVTGELEVLEENIGPDGNRTRFYVIEAASRAAPACDRGLIAFEAPHQPGALHACLAPFAELGVDLSRIESRPSRQEAWTYHFIVEIEGDPSAGPGEAALQGLSEVASKVQVLGAWSRPAPS